MSIKSGLYHDFHLLSIDQYPFEKELYLNLLNSPQAISLHDDVIGYIWDSLLWIPSFLPHRRLEKYQGLSRFGPTVIKENGADHAKRVFKAWADLFSVGPPTLKLTGDYGWRCDDVTLPEGYGKVIAPEQFNKLLESVKAGYHSIKLERDDVSGTLNILAEYAAKVSESGGRYYLLHLGI